MKQYKWLGKINTREPRQGAHGQESPGSRSTDHQDNNSVIAPSFCSALRRYALTDLLFATGCNACIGVGDVHGRTLMVSSSLSSNCPFSNDFARGATE